MTLVLNILGAVALAYLACFVGVVAWIVLSGRREERRAREAKAAAVREATKGSAAHPSLDEFLDHTDRLRRVRQMRRTARWN